MMRVNWWMLVLISMALFAGQILGTVLMAYLMAWRDNRKNQEKKGVIK